MSVVEFPRAHRERREHILEVAAAAAPLLEAAVASGDAAMIERIFEALGEFAGRRDALGCLESAEASEAQIVQLRR
jgi:hypothetical protein